MSITVAASLGGELEEAAYTIRQHGYAVGLPDLGSTTNLQELAEYLNDSVSGWYFDTSVTSDFPHAQNCDGKCVLYPVNRWFDEITFDLPETNPTEEQILEAAARLSDVAYYGHADVSNVLWDSESLPWGSSTTSGCSAVCSIAEALEITGPMNTSFYANPQWFTAHAEFHVGTNSSPWIYSVHSASIATCAVDYVMPTQQVFTGNGAPVLGYLMPTVGDGLDPGEVQHAALDATEMQCPRCTPGETTYWRENFIFDRTVYARLEMPSEVCGAMSYGTCQAGGMCGSGIPRVGVDPLDLHVTVVDTPLSRASALGPALEIRMRYDQRYASYHADGPFGYGWQWSYGGHIAEYGDDDAMRVVLQDGSVIQFFYNSGSDDYSGPPSLGYELTEETNGTFRLEHERGGGYGFLAPSNGVGQLSYIEDGYGNRLSLEYSGGALSNIYDAVSNSFTISYSTNGLITSVTNNAGLSADFTYTNGMLSTVTDMGEHEYTYQYGGSGPARITNIVTEAGSTSIDYGGGLAIEVTDPTGASRVYGMPETNGLARFQVNGRGYTNWTYYAYTVRGLKVVCEVDALGYETAYTLDDLGRRTVVTNAQEQVASRFVYDDHGNVLHEINALGQTNSYLYSNDDLDRIAAIDTLGNTNSYGFDADHNMIAMTNEAGGVFGYGYTDGLKTSETNAEGLVTSYTHDTEGQLTQTINSLGATNAFAYDSLGRLWVETSPSGLIVTNEYDGLNRVTARKYPDGTSETFGYSCCGMTSETNRRGYVTSHTYDAVGRRTSTTDVYSNTTTNHLDANGNVTFTSNSLSFTVTTFYDELDRPEQMIYANPSTNLYSESMDYDALGRVTNRVGRRGETTTYQHDALGRVTNVLDGVGRSLEQRTYDAGGRVQVQTDVNGVTVTNQYDDIGRLTRVTMSDGTYTESTYSYVSNGLYKVRNRLGKFTWYTRDDAGRVTAVRDPEGRVTEYGFDEAGRMVILTDANDNETSFEYDVYGHLTEKTYDDDVSWEYTFDAGGNLTTSVNGRSEQTIFTYDAGDLPLTINYSNDTDITFGYDILGRVTSRVDAAGTTLFTYGDVVHLTQVDGPFTNDTLTFSYDGDLKASATLNGTHYVDYTWDLLGRLEEVDASCGTFSYGYQGTKMQPVSLTNASGASVSYTVDELAQLVAITNRNDAGTAISSFGYTYDNGGRRTRMTLLGGDYIDYGYDDSGQVTSAVRRTSGGALVPGYSFGYGYDAAGNMLTNEMTGVDRRMDYNNLNQLTNRYWASLPGGIDVLGAISPVGTGVTVNAEDALLRADDSFAATNVAISVGANSFTGVVQDASGGTATNVVAATVETNRVFTYDANGNVLSDGYFTNTWNDADRLIAWEKGGTRLEFVYDGQGRRVIKREIEGGSTNTTRYIWDGWLPFAIQDGNGTVTELQVWGRDLSGTLEGAGGIGGLLAVHEIATGDTYEHFCDAQGNISEVLLDGEYVIAAYQYAPFGTIVAQSGPYEARYRFSSKEFDEQSGLCYFGYRYLNPDTGRWANRDPIGERGGANVYGFVKNSPLSRVDYLGLAGLPIDPSWPAQFFMDYVGSRFEAAFKHQAVCHLVRVHDHMGDDKYLITSVKIPSSISPRGGGMIKFYMHFHVSWSNRPGSRGSACGSCWYTAYHFEYRTRRTSPGWRIWNRDYELYTVPVVDLAPYECEAFDRNPWKRCRMIG